MNLSVQVTGIDETKQAIRDYVEAIRKGVPALIEEYTIRIARLAKSRVDVDLADLRASIHIELERKAGEVIGRVSAGRGLDDPDVAAFVEFGTGRFVQVPAGLENYALRFYRTGEGRLPASPYLFPAFESQRVRFMQDLMDLVKTGKMP